ncbi:pilus assembly PilX family protein [Methylocucumis oryzae]|nr:hypothetical protein [Methylocucumis oryzae]
MRDYNIALQAAEAGIRDAEQDITNQMNPNHRFCKSSGFAPDCGFTTAQTSDDGLCTNNGGYSPDVRTALTNGFCPTPPPNANIAVVCLPAIADPFNGPPSVVYGTFTGARPLPQVSAQPRYLIEAYQSPTQTAGNKIPFYYYRITVKAQGLNPATVVWLHSVFKIPNHSQC